MNNKICPKCNINKSISEFNKYKKRKDGMQVWCKKCMSENRYERYHKSIDVRERFYISARKTLVKKYNISWEEYLELIKKQNNKCDICVKEETQRSNKNGRIDSLRIDHDHKTGKVRGLLCSKCNFGISQFNDDIKLLYNAIKYIERNK